MMGTPDPRIAKRAKQIYEERLRTQLEATEADRFVAIEPESGDYFLGETLSEAIGKSRTRHPNRLPHAIRVVHKAALHFGIAFRDACAVSGHLPS
jgi:hypothetical protein